MTIFSGRDGRTFDITCPDGTPEIGRWYDLNGYKFQATLHGPMHWGTCVDCGKPALEAQPTGIATDVSGTESRCDSCGRIFHGARLDYYRTGRALLYRTVSLPDRTDPQHGGTVELADFLAQVEELKRAPHERPARCDSCAALIDPAARTVEHPNLHPTCVRDWARIRADAPMENPLRSEGEN